MKNLVEWFLNSSYIGKISDNSELHFHSYFLASIIYFLSFLIFEFAAIFNMAG